MFGESKEQYRLPIYSVSSLSLFVNPHLYTDQDPLQRAYGRMQIFFNKKTTDFLQCHPWGTPQEAKAKQPARGYTQNNPFVKLILSRFGFSTRSKPIKVSLAVHL